MSTREESAKMRRALGAKGIEETDIERLRQTASDIYNTIGYDMGWADGVDDEEEFVDVLRDRMADELDDEDLEIWNRMSISEKGWLVLEVM